MFRYLNFRFSIIKIGSYSIVFVWKVELLVDLMVADKWSRPFAQNNQIEDVLHGE